MTWADDDATGPLRGTVLWLLLLDIRFIVYDASLTLFHDVP